MEVYIKNLGINGEGITRIQGGDLDNKVCFVDFALPNEKVDIDITNSKSKFCKGKLNKIIEKSAYRVEPKCPYFAICGGCDLQHLEISKQREFKKKKVTDALRKSIVDNVILDDTKYSNEWEYRNKMVFAVRDENGQKKIGMFHRNSHKVIEVDECILTNNIINSVYAKTRDFIISSSFSAYSEKTRKGDIKYIVIREYSGNILLTIVATKNLDLKAFYEYLNSTYSIGVSIVISDSDTEILSGKYKHLFGLEELEISEYGIKYRLNNLGFLQVNNYMKKAMYDMVLSHIESDTNIVDAYGGAGLLSAIMSCKARSVIGIEINESASNSAKNLAKENNLKNVKFICDDVEKSLPNIVGGIDNIVLVLDPPRSGCSRGVCETILCSSDKIKKIIYISCNPATLGRDLEILSREFVVTKVVPFDLFPQTKHIETLVVLDRKN